MAQEWQGKVALDIRDATPDWTPFLAPEAPPGAPDVLLVCWDDVGYGTMEPRGRGVRLVPHRLSCSPVHGRGTTSSPRRSDGSPVRPPQVGDRRSGAPRLDAS